jgi:hypothetical protein
MDNRPLAQASILALSVVLAAIALAPRTTPPITGRVVSTGSPVAARFSHTATLLPNNQVLIAGGMERNGVWLDSAELYDPASGRFTSVGKMGSRRAGAMATLLPNGKVLIAGGSDGSGGSLSSAEIYDPASNTFAAAGTMTSPRAHAVAVLLQDGKVLIAGGSSAGDNARVATAELYDPATGKFVSTGSMHNVRSYNAAVQLKDGKVLVIGGIGRGEFPNPQIESSAEIYDPAAGRFTPTGSMAVARCKQGVELLPDGRVLVVGGQNSGPNGARLASIEIYDPAAGKFTSGPETHTKRFKLHDGVVTLRNGRVLLASGADQMELYDPASKSFMAVGGVPLNGFLFSTATLLHDGRVLLVGGYGMDTGAGAVRHAWIYAP